MAITGISSYDGKQIVAAGAQSATKAYQDSNGDVITSKYQSTADMSNYVKNTDPVISVGFENTATNWSFSQGEQNNAVTFSLAQGNQNTALTVSFAQGSANYARGDSFAQGSGCKADQKSIAQGADCSAAYSAQAFGVGVVAKTGMMAIGSYNNKTAYASFVIGNGTANDARSDIFYIDKSGNVSAAGKISANGVELGPGGAGVVTSTAGDGTYVTAINETPLSGAGGTQVVTSIHTAEYGVMAGTSATAVDKINGMGLFAQSGWSAVNAGWAKSAVSAYKDGNGRVIANTYQTTDGMTAYPNSADVTGTAQYGLTTAGWTEITGGGGGGYTGNAQEALDEVYSNSGNWNSVYNHVSTASAGWTGGGGGGSTDVTLWEASNSGQKSGVFELSDSLTNYKRYGIYYYLAGYRGCVAGGYSELVYRPEWSGFTLMGNDTTANNDGSSAIFKGYSYGSATNNTINIFSSVTLYSTNLTAQPSNLRTGKSAGLVITKIVGIN